MGERFAFYYHHHHHHTTITRHIFRTLMRSEHIQMPNVIPIADKQSWKVEVIQSDLPVFVDFWATWCGPSRTIKPIIDEVSDEYDGKVKFVRVDLGEMGHLVETYDINTAPTLVMLYKESVLYWGEGMGTKQVYKKIIDKALAYLATDPPIHPAVGRYGPDPPATPLNPRDYCRHWDGPI